MRLQAGQGIWSPVGFAPQLGGMSQQQGSRTPGGVAKAAKTMGFPPTWRWVKTLSGEVIRKGPLVQVNWQGMAQVMDLLRIAMD